MALRWSEAASGLTGILYYDIQSGTDASRLEQWTLKGGDGSNIDTNVNAIDIVDLTEDYTGEALLDDSVVMIGASFSNPEQGFSNFQLYAEPAVLPEPSSCTARNL